MTEQIKKFFLLGFVPSLFGGLVLERSQGHLTNVIHLYTWILLFAIPIAIVMVREMGVHMSMKDAQAHQEIKCFFVSSLYSGETMHPHDLACSLSLSFPPKQHHLHKAVPNLSAAAKLAYPIALAFVYALILAVNGFLHAAFDKGTKLPERVGQSIVSVCL